MPIFKNLARRNWKKLKLSKLNLQIGWLSLPQINIKDLSFRTLVHMMLLCYITLINHVIIVFWLKKNTNNSPTLLFKREEVQNLLKKRKFSLECYCLQIMQPFKKFLLDMDSLQCHLLQFPQWIWNVKVKCKDSIHKKINGLWQAMKFLMLKSKLIFVMLDSGQMFK